VGGGKEQHGDPDESISSWARQMYRKKERIEEVAFHWIVIEAQPEKLSIREKKGKEKRLIYKIS
jgi:D-mannonate dehydratase